MGRRAWRAALSALAILGPGLITGAAGDDAGGVATYATIGAQFGYSMIWALILITVSLVVVQVQVARMAVVTGKGLDELIRERFGVRWTAFAMLVLLIANGSVTVAEFAGIAAAGQLVGIPTTISVPVSAVAVWLIVVRGSYSLAEKVFVVVSAGLLSYVGSAILAHPDWHEVAIRSITPTFLPRPDFVTQLVALVGTTITPYMLFFLQASIVDKGDTLGDYRRVLADVSIGAIASDLAAFFIIVSTAATLFPAGIAVQTAQDAARALVPFAGRYAEILFGAGLYGASMLAASVLPLSTAYALCGAFGWERGLSWTWREAPLFNGLYTLLIVIGAVLVLIPGLPLIPLIVGTQVLNGILLPVILVFVAVLASNRKLMGGWANGPVFRILSVGTTIVVALLAVASVVTGFLSGG